MTGEVDVTGLLRELGRGARTARALSQAQARGLFAAMLADEIDELRLGALLIAYRIKGETAAELAGMLEAAHAALAPLRLRPAPFAPVVIPSYSGARRLPNLVPLLALALAARGVPVLVHGDAADGHDRVGSAAVFEALGIGACASRSQAETALASPRRLAFVPIDVLAPPLARLLALRERTGLRNSAHTVVKLLDPIDAPALRLVSYTHPPYRDALLELFATVQPPPAPGVLLARGHEGEAAADPRRQVAVEWLADGAARTVLDAGPVDAGDSAALPPRDALSTARWTARVLAGELALPATLQRQIDTVVALAGGARPPAATDDARGGKVAAMVAVDRTPHAVMAGTLEENASCNTC
jgi:anthranilate phosphoribosyltransferase